jgi:ferredoxin--NADP+ reductase
MEAEMGRASEELLVATDDGSYGHHGFVTDVLQEVIEREGKDNVALVMAIGPVPMMRACCKVTARYEVRTEVSLNPIMVDATGMCGACRVTVGGETKFACVDGPEFDGHQVDFDELTKRLRMYLEDERRAMQEWSEHHGAEVCYSGN